MPVLVFPPISPLVMAMTNSGGRRYTGNAEERLRLLIQDIRRASARQHCEKVLIYEVVGTADRHLTPLAIADLTIIGALMVPSRISDALGVANALLLDVRNGYPYAYCSGIATRRGIHPASGRRRGSRRSVEAAETAATLVMIPRAEAMLKELMAHYRNAQQEEQQAAADGQKTAADTVATTLEPAEK